MTDETRLCGEKFKNLEPLLKQIATADESRLQHMLPGKNPSGCYEEHDWLFYDHFLNQNCCGVNISEKCVIMGDQRYLDGVMALVDHRMVEIQEITELATPKIVVFLGNGTTMLSKYSRTGISLTGTITKPPFAWGGAQACFINTDYIDEFGLNAPEVVRAILHESAHPAFYQSLLGADGYPTWQLDCSDRLLSEALAGPNDPSFWEDLQPPEEVKLDFGLLERGELGFYDWLDKIIEDYEIKVPYFQNWAVAEFYRWASRQGDLAYWYQKALELKP